MNRFTEFYRISPPAPAREMDADARATVIDFLDAMREAVDQID